MIITPGSNPVYLGPPSVPVGLPPAQIRSLEAYYTQTPTDPCGAGVCINFFPLSGAEISRYGIYRSVDGFMADKVAPSVVDGKTLTLAINLGPSQTLTFDSSTPIVDKINGFFAGVRATASMEEPMRFFVRVDGGGIAQVIGGTALPDLGLLAGTYSHQSTDYLVKYIFAAPEDDVEGVEWCDRDGTLLDSYRVTTVNLANEESGKTAYVMPTETTGKVCWVYGYVSNVSGTRIPDSPVNARILEMPQTVVPPSYINEEVITVMSNPQGKFETCLLQGSLVEISIPAIYFHRVLRIPLQNRVSIASLLVDRDYRYPLETEV